MAATRVVGTGIDNNGRQKQVSRLGHARSEAQVATWHTFLDAQVEKSGRGWMQVRRDGARLLDIVVEEEAGDLKDVVTINPRDNAKTLILHNGDYVTLETLLKAYDASTQPEAEWKR